MSAGPHQVHDPHPRLAYTLADASLGLVLVAATPRGLCCVLIGDEPVALVEDLQRRFPDAVITAVNRGVPAPVTTMAAQVVAMIERPSLTPTPPLDLRGTEFQQRVWEALRAIPAGETRSYGEVARALGEPGLARAVAGACAANHVAVVVPCHRVLRANGGLSGYRWGIERKRALLEREGGLRR